MDWQTWLQGNLPPGTRETSGYRTPQQEAALGGPATSYHSRGTPGAPGAIDVGGPADQLKALFEKIKVQFKGRINELYLNLPGGGSLDVKNNQYLGTNPEAGRPQHLHVALQPTTGPQPASGIPAENRGDRALAAAPAGVCARSFEIPTAKSAVDRLKGQNTPGLIVCWSDVWIYGAALGLIVGGSWLVMRGKE